MSDLNGYRQNVVNSGAPDWYYTIDYSQTGRTGSSVSYTFTIGIELTEGRFGYGSYLRTRATVNGSTTGWVYLYGSNSFPYGSLETVSFGITVSAGSGGGSLSASVEWDCCGYASSPVHSYSGTVNVSTWNTPPTLSGYVSQNPSGIVPENTSSIVVSWPAACDYEQGTKYYDVYRYINGAQNAKIVSGMASEATSGTTLSITDYIGTPSQGSKYSYRVEASDGYVMAANGIGSSDYTTINTLTGASVSASSSIGYWTNSINFSIWGASNANGNTDFSYNLSSPNITVYNGGSPGTLTIYKGGTAPNNAYIRWDDLQNVVKGNSWTGTLTFYLTTYNDYGSSSTNSTNVWVDLRVCPVAATSISASGTVAVKGNNYFIPDRQTITASWGGAYDYLGAGLTYDVQVSLNGGSYTTYASNITSTSANVGIGAVESATSCSFRIVARTNFGYTNYSDSGSITLNYYRGPAIAFGSVNRTASTALVSVATYVDTSIPGINLTSQYYNGKAGTNISFSGSPYTISETGLVGTDKYNITVTLQDDSGLSSTATSRSTYVPVYTPLLCVREKGVGINAIPDGSNILTVGGNVAISGKLTVGDLENSHIIPVYLKHSGDCQNDGKGTSQWIKICRIYVNGNWNDIYTEFELGSRGEIGHFSIHINTGQYYNSNPNFTLVVDHKGCVDWDTNNIKGCMKADTANGYTYVDIWVYTDYWSAIYHKAETFIAPSGGGWAEYPENVASTSAPSTSSYDTIQNAQYHIVHEAQIADTLTNDNGSAAFHWVGKDGQPPWLWGGVEPSNMYVYNPSNFCVASAKRMDNGGGVSVTCGTGDNASWDTYNMRISSWFGIGFYDSCYNKTTAVLNCRTGDLSIKGDYYVSNHGGDFITALSPTNQVVKLKSFYVGITNGSWATVDYSDLHLSVYEHIQATVRGSYECAFVKNESKTTCQVSLAGSNSGGIYVLVAGA